MTSSDTDIGKVWELADKIGFCMLTTQTGTDLRARPMSAYSEQLENAFYFLTDVASHKDEEISRSPNVCLAFADSKVRNMFLSPASQRCRMTVRKLRNCGPRPQRPGGIAQKIHPFGF